MNLYFKQTCEACPEQYDVLDLDDNSKQVAYVRLRWGHLRVDVPDCGGNMIYSHEFDDGLKGCFYYGERDGFLEEIQKQILAYYGVK